MTSEKRLQILLVDDDRSSRVVCSIALEGLGFDVLSASEGAEALELLDGDYGLDVIMLDLRMPGMDGWEFLQHYAGKIPIVVVSAWWDDKPLPGHPFAVVPKPADMREVAVMLRQAARSAGRLQ